MLFPSSYREWTQIYYTIPLYTNATYVLYFLFPIFLFRRIYAEYRVFLRLVEAIFLRVFSENVWFRRMFLNCVIKEIEMHDVFPSIVRIDTLFWISFILVFVVNFMYPFWILYWFSLSYEFPVVFFSAVIFVLFEGWLIY